MNFISNSGFKSLKDKRAPMLNYFKHGNLNLKEDKDVIKLVEFYHTLSQ